METGGTFTHPVDILSSRPSDGDDENSKPEAWFTNASPAGMAVPFGETYVICAEPGEIKPTYRTDSFTVDDESQRLGCSALPSGRAVDRPWRRDQRDEQRDHDHLRGRQQEGQQHEARRRDLGDRRQLQPTLDILPEAYAVCVK